MRSRNRTKTRFTFIFQTSRTGLSLNEVVVLQFDSWRLTEVWLLGMHVVRSKLKRGNLIMLGITTSRERYCVLNHRRMDCLIDSMYKLANNKTLQVNDCCPCVRGARRSPTKPRRRQVVTIASQFTSGSIAS